MNEMNELDFDCISFRGKVFRRKYPAHSMLCTDDPLEFDAYIKKHDKEIAATIRYMSFGIPEMSLAATLAYIRIKKKEAKENYRLH